MVERRRVNRRAKFALLGIGIVSSILGVISTSIALYLQTINNRDD